MRFERSPITDALVAYMRGFEKGTLLPYDDISTHVSPVDSADHRLRSARFILERDHHQIWVCVRPRVGLRRLDDREIAERLGAWWLTGARRKLSRGGDQAGNVDVQALDLAQQTRFSVHSIQRELAFQSLSRPVSRQLEKVARGTSNDLPSFNIVEWAISLTPRKSR